METSHSVVSTPIASTCAASHGQRLIWMLEHYRGADGALNCPLLARARGPLDPGALRSAIDRLTDRHEALRTTFTGRGSRLVQQIHLPGGRGPFRLVDLSTSLDPEADLASAISTEARTPVDVRIWPLRTTVWRIDSAQHVLCINLHHLVTDGWSCGLIVRELAALLRSGDLDPGLAPIAWQYSRFATWQNERLAADGFPLERRYWIEKLAGATPPAIPLRPAEHALLARGASLSADIPPDTLNALRVLARAERSTLFTVMLSLYYALLGRITGQSDLAVASLMANRARPEVQGTVGHFANLVVLRTRLPASPTIRERIRSTHETVMGAMVHQAYPHHLLPAGIIAQSERRSDDVVFQLIPAPLTHVQAGPTRLEFQTPDAIGARFELELELYPTREGLRALLFFNAQRIDASWARGFLEAYVREAHEVAQASRCAR